MTTLARYNVHCATAVPTNQVQLGTLCSSESETPPLIWGRSVESVGSKVAQLWEATDGSLPTFLMMLWQVTMEMAANRYIQ